MLIGESVSKNFGGLTALKNVNFSVKKGEIVGLIGPNGSGKTTLFNVITGFYKPDNGTIIFEGKQISGLSPNRISNMGIGRTFQIVKPLTEMTVIENVAVASLYGRAKISSLSEGFQDAERWVRYCGLEKKRSTIAKNLTLAELKRLEIARALALRPKLLLLDEPIAGLNPVEIEEACALIRKIRAELEITVFIIEHVMKALMGISDRIIVLNYGEKIAEGKPEEIGSNPNVIKAYLGERYAKS